MSESLSPLQKKIEAALVSHTGGNVQVRALKPLIGGAIQENWVVDAIIEKGELAGPQRLALRSDPRQKLAISLTRRQEFEVITAAVAAGVKTPRARWLTPNLVRD